MNSCFTVSTKEKSRNAIWVAWITGRIQFTVASGQKAILIDLLLVWILMTEKDYHAIFVYFHGKQLISN